MQNRLIWARANKKNHVLAWSYLKRIFNAICKETLFTWNGCRMHKFLGSTNNPHTHTKQFQSACQHKQALQNTLNMYINIYFICVYINALFAIKTKYVAIYLVTLCSYMWHTVQSGYGRNFPCWKMEWCVWYALWEWLRFSAAHISAQLSIVF